MGAAHVAYAEAPLLLLLLCNISSHVYEEGTFLWIFIDEVEADIFAGFFASYPASVFNLSYK